MKKILFFQIDLERSLDEQGPFDAIVHKLSDVMLSADYGNDSHARSLCDRIHVFN